jgi:vacuolar-type H+-ATPase subunit E/Vma4
MTSISQAANYLRARGRIFIDVVFTKAGEEIKHISKMVPGEDLEEKLENIISSFDPDELTIEIYKPNGSSKKFEKRIAISLPQQQMQQSQPKTSIAPKASFQPSSLMGVSHPGSFSGWEQYALVQEQNKNVKLEAYVQRLESERDALREKRVELERKLEVMQKDFEIERIQAEGEYSSGLNGILGNEKLVEVFAPLLVNLLSSKPGNPPASALGNSVEFDDESNSGYMGELSRMISSAAPHVQTKYYALSKFLLEHPNGPVILDQIINNIKPN